MVTEIAKGHTKTPTSELKKKRRNINVKSKWDKTENAGSEEINKKHEMKEDELEMSREELETCLTRNLNALKDKRGS